MRTWSLILIQGIEDPGQITIDSRIYLQKNNAVKDQFNQRWQSYPRQNTKVKKIILIKDDDNDHTPGTPFVPHSFGPKLTTPISWNLGRHDDDKDDDDKDEHGEDEHE